MGLTKQNVPDLFLQVQAEERCDEQEELEECVNRRVWDAVDQLPDLQRSVVKLRYRYHVGLSTRETAAAVGRAEGAVKASLHQGLNTLRSEMGDLQDHWMSGDL